MNNEKKVDIVLEEYKALRAETQSRSQKQFFSVSASIIAVGTLIGIFLQNTATNYPIILIIPWVLTVFGIYWVDNAESIRGIGKFIGDEIEKNKIPSLTGEDAKNLLTWQTSVNEKYIDGDIRDIPYIIIFIPLVYFILPSVIAIIAFIYCAKQLSLIAIFSVVFINSLLVGCLIYQLVGSFKRSYIKSLFNKKSNKKAL